MADLVLEIKYYNFLVTETAGCVDLQLRHYPLSQGAKIIGVDHFNDHYSPRLKHDQDQQLRRFSRFLSLKADLADYPPLKVFQEHRPTNFGNLSAQAGALSAGQTFAFDHNLMALQPPQGSSKTFA
jgi:hypothetical protein